MRRLTQEAGPSTNHEGDASKERIVKETVLGADGDLFPKVTRSGSGAAGTTPPGNSTSASRINPAAALGTRPQLLADAMAAPMKRLVGAGVDGGPAT